MRRRVAALVLAAGRSTRMGAVNKLLALVDGEPVVTRAVDAALSSAADPVLVVTGHEAGAVYAALAGREIVPVANPRFAEGMGTSLAAGVAALPAGVEAALVCLGDMPWVRAADLDALIAAFAGAPGDAICVPTHAGRRGHPVLFAARYFGEISQLSGDTGARALIEAHPGALRTVPVDHPGVLQDVDVAEDLERSCRP